MGATELNPEDVPSREGLLYFVHYKAERYGEFVEHSGIVFPGQAISSLSSGSYEFRVYDWPPLGLEVNRGRAPDGTRLYQTEGYLEWYEGLTFAWCEGVAADWQCVYETAAAILTKPLRSHNGGGIHTILFMLHPAKTPDYCKNPETLEKFFRGSCAGFVEHCVESGGFRIVDENELPEVETRDSLNEFAAGRVCLRLDRDALAGSSQHSLFEGEFPMRLLFPAYLLAGLKSDGPFPFVPSFADVGYDASD